MCSEGGQVPQGLRILWIGIGRRVHKKIVRPPKEPPNFFGFLSPQLEIEGNLNRCNVGRRTFITRLADKGIGVHVLAALAEHSSIAITQLYIDVNDEQLANAVELL
jgi:integrase